MLGGDAVDQRHRVVETAHHDDAPKSRHDAAGDLGARQRRELALDRRFDRVGERGIVGDQDRLRGGVVLGLRQQIGGDPVGIAGLSATTSTSDGPAIMSMPTVPNTCRLAAAT